MAASERAPKAGVSREVRAQIEGIRVACPRWQGIVEEIGRCQEWGPGTAEPPCLLVVGPTGAGKSTLVASYARDYPPVLTETGTTYPVVRVTIPTPATIKALAMMLLAAVGDPRATSGTVGAMTYGLTHAGPDTPVLPPPASRRESRDRRDLGFPAPEPPRSSLRPWGA